MWLVKLVAIATKYCEIDPHPEWGSVKGAYINALISFPDPDGAKRLAKMYATELDKQWRFRHFTYCQKVTLANFKAAPEYREYFAEAKRDGYSLIYHFYCAKNKTKAGIVSASFASAAKH